MPPTELAGLQEPLLPSAFSEEAQEEKKGQILYVKVELMTRKFFLLVAFTFARLPGLLLSAIQAPLALFSLVIIIMPPTLGYVYIFMVMPLVAPSMEPFAGALRKAMGLKEHDKVTIKLGAFLLAVCFVPPLLESVFDMILRFAQLDNSDPNFYYKALGIWWEQSIAPYQQLDLLAIYKYATKEISFPDVVALLAI